MTLKLVVSGSLGEAAPLLVTVNADLAEAIALALGELQARVTGLLKMQATLEVGIGPPTLVATVKATAQVLLNLQAAIGGPVVTLQIAAIAAILLGLNASIAGLEAMISLDLGGSVFAYSFDGSASDLGPQVTAATSGGFPGGAPTDHANALILATTTPATWALIQAIFKT